MQIMEVDDRAVRAAVWTFQHPINCPRFVLFPIAHMAEPAFYENVTARVGRSDLAVVEGIVGKSRHAKAIVSIYDLVARMDHLGLVVENIDYRAMSIPLVRPDMTGEAFDRRWRRAPVRHRLLLRASRLAFAFGSVRRHVTRRVVADVLDAQAGSMNVSIENEESHRVASRVWGTLLDDDERDRLLVRSRILARCSAQNFANSCLQSTPGRSWRCVRGSRSAGQKESSARTRSSGLTGDCSRLAPLLAPHTNVSESLGGRRPRCQARPARPCRPPRY